MGWTEFALALGILLVFGLVYATGSAQAEIDGHGPDAWRVVGVAPDDVLNMRMGPGAEYLVIDRLAPDARGLEQITCVPLLIPSVYHKLSEGQRDDLPQRWCLMRSADLSRAGWVSARFLMEDTPLDVGGTSDAFGPDVVETTGDDMIDAAVLVVRDLYAAFDTPSGAPVAPGQAKRYFFADIVPALAGHGADLLYNAQDFAGRITRIGPDHAQPMLGGMIAVTVDFTNFGQTRQAVFRLRAGTAQAGAPVRIFSVELDGWTFPG